MDAPLEMCARQQNRFSIPVIPFPKIFKRCSLHATLALALVSPLFGAAPELEVAAKLVVPPGNIAVTPDKRVLVSLHQFFEPKNRVVEIKPDGAIQPFPNAEMSTGSAGALLALDSVLGIAADKTGTVWLLDNGMRDGTVPKLVAWDAQKNRISRVIYIPPPATLKTSFLNDLAIDLKRNVVYIADPASGSDAALIVVHLATGISRRLLQGHPSVLPEDIDIKVKGKVLTATKPDGTRTPVRVGVNPIALDAKQEWLYFGPMSGSQLYRMPAADLADDTISQADVSRSIESYASRPSCDGIAMDAKGHIFISDVQAEAVGVIMPNKQYRVLVSDERLSWPDAFAFSPDGYLYVVANQLHLSPRLNQGKDEAVPPFLILKFKPKL